MERDSKSRSASPSKGRATASTSMSPCARTARRSRRRSCTGPGWAGRSPPGTTGGAEKGFLPFEGEGGFFSAPEREEAGTAVSVDAAGVASHYFAAIMLPEPGGLYGSRLTKTTIPGAKDVEEGASRKPHDAITASLAAPGSPASVHLF